MRHGAPSNQVNMFYLYNTYAGTAHPQVKSIYLFNPPNIGRHGEPPSYVARLTCSVIYIQVSTRPKKAAGSTTPTSQCPCTWPLVTMPSVNAPLVSLPLVTMPAVTVPHGVGPSYRIMPVYALFDPITYIYICIYIYIYMHTNRRFTLSTHIFCSAMG